MGVTTENGEVTLPYLFHCRKRDVQVAHCGLWEALCGFTLLEECKTAAGLLAGIPHLQREQRFLDIRLSLFLWIYKCVCMNLWRDTVSIWMVEEHKKKQSLQLVEQKMPWH